MIAKRIFVIVAALCAALALLSNAPPTQADELSDLRANEQLLQQRLDQLSRAQQPGGSVPAPTVGPAVGAGSFPRSFLLPGTDTSVRVGGNINETATYYFNGGRASR